MKLILKKLHIENFISFEDATIEFNNKGYTIVSGRNENPTDNAQSNGCGKSSLQEGIIWCLTGETIRGSKDVKNLFTQGTTKAELDFSIDNKDYKLIRTKDPSNLFFYVEGENKSGKGIRDTSEIVSQYLPDLTSQLLASVIILGQGLPGRFTNNSPSGRKEVLEKLFKTDYMITDIKTKIASRSNFLQDKKRQTEDSILTDQTKKDLFEKELASAQKQLAYYKNFDTDSANKQIDELNSSITEHQVQIDNQSKELEQLNINLTKGLDELNIVNSEFTIALNKVSSNHSIEESSYKDAEAQQKADIRSLEAEITRLKNIKDICPTCHRKLDGVEKPDTTLQEQNLENLKQRYSEHSKKYEEFKNKLAEEQRDINTNFNSKLDDIRKQNSSYQAQIQIINRNIIGLTSEQNQLEKDKNTLEISLTSLNNSINTLTDNISTLSNDINNLEKNILYNNSERDKIQEHLEVLSKMNTLSTRDFRGYLLSDIIAHIDKQAKAYSKLVFNNTALDFSLDGNNLNVKFDNKDYEALSGGEKQKVDIIIQFAIREELCKNLGFSCNCIMLDEIFDNLDFNGCEKILNLISKELIDVDNIFIITHHTDISIPADNTLFIVKGKDKISRII